MTPNKRVGRRKLPRPSAETRKMCRSRPPMIRPGLGHFGRPGPGLPYNGGVMQAPRYRHLVDAIRRHVLGQNPEQAWVFDNLVFLHIGGSTLYGTDTPDSDLDVRGVTIPPKSYWVG